MSGDNVHTGWYALFVKTGEEDNIKLRLQYRLRKDRLKVIIPKRKLKERKNGEWNSRVRTLFPGYILINGLIGYDEYYCIRDVPGVIKVLGDRNGPLEIQEDEIMVIKRLILDDEVIGYSSVYNEGGRIKVTDGPLLGMEGLISSIDKRKGRAKVRLDFLGETRVVELSVKMVQMM